jgi:hypothetical protein
VRIVCGCGEAREHKAAYATVRYLKVRLRQEGGAGKLSKDREIGVYRSRPLERLT